MKLIIGIFLVCISSSFAIDYFWGARKEGDHILCKKAVNYVQNDDKIINRDITYPRYVGF